jgi:hypothetical protein
MNPLRPNQAVTLVDDAEFLGYVVGQMVNADGQPTGQVMLSISNPGATGLRGNKAIAIERLVPLDGSQPNSVPTRQRAGRGPQRARANLHTAPQEVSR